MGHDVSEVTETSEAVELGEKLWLDAGGNVVKDGDPAAAELLGIPGQRLSREDAIRYGLVKPSAEEKKQQMAAEETAAVSDPDPAVFSEEKAAVTKQDRPKANKQRSASRNKGRR